jgi:mRNA interferase MazF
MGMGINRGEIYFVNLDPVIGFELGKKPRPVVVLSINDINRKPLVVTVVPGTSQFRQPHSFRNMVVIDPSAENGLRTATAFQGHQLRAIDHARFIGGPIGRLSAADLERVEAVVRFSLGLV